MDNTVRENKNQTVIQYVAWLVGKLNQRCAGMMFSVVGHTHDILGTLIDILSKQLCDAKAAALS